MISTSTTHIRVRFRNHRLLQALITWYALVWVVTAGPTRRWRPAAIAATETLMCLSLVVILVVIPKPP